MHVVHWIAGISRAHGGTSTFVVELANAQARLPGTRVTLITATRGGDDLPVTSDVVLLHHDWPQALGRLLSRLHRDAPIDVVHVHGLWRVQSHVLSQFALTEGIPLVLATHGMLEAHALRLKRWRKLAALLCFQRADLVAASALSATAAPEAAHLRQAGFRQPVLVAPPGVTIPVHPSPGSPDADGCRTALVLARIHPVKNLLGLVRAWALARPDGWRLVISGPDPDGHAATVREAIRQATISDEVRVVGPQYDEEKDRLFRSASLFILPSFTENFGIVVAEALSYGVPVIATFGTPWQLLEREACGWWVDPSPESLAAGLRTATLLAPESLRAMGARGRAVAESHFQWSRIAAATRAGYAWLLDGGPVPPSMELATPV